MQQLQLIVDSLNLKFKRCDLTKKYYTVKQGKAIQITVKGKSARKVLQDVINGIQPDVLISKYPLAEVQRNLLLLVFNYTTDDNEDIAHYKTETLDEEDGVAIKLGVNDKYGTRERTGNFVYYYSKETKYSDEYIELIFITEEPAVKELPEKYARMILYTECMVDTTQGIYLETAQNSGRWFYRQAEEQSEKAVHYKAFLNYIDENTKNIEAYYTIDTSLEDRWYLMDSCKKVFIKEKLSGEKRFKRLLEAAVIEVLQNNIPSNSEFEDYTAEYYSKKDALTMKRNRKVFGSCSMDNSPRVHAMSIAVLAAESISWEVFLRAHLDIMNDRFDRASDGSYAWAGRGTYIKEIEELNIEVQELLLGISLRISNPSKNHYYGNISRLGRALAETQNRIALEEQILSMIQDPLLDIYNRILMHYLFLNYTYYLPDQKLRLDNLKKLELADQSLPQDIKVKIKIKRENFEDK